MYGVEFQTNVVQQLLNENYRFEISGNIQYLVLFLMCFLLGICYMNLKMGFSSALCAAVLAADFIVCSVVYDGGYVLHPLWLPVGSTLIWIVSVVRSYMRAAVERKQITNTF